jgi:hypothetical protein
MLPELLTSADPVVRRLAVQMAPAGTLTAEQLGRAAQDENGWVRAAAAVGGAAGGEDVLAELRTARDPRDRAAGAWAAAFEPDAGAVAEAMGDPDPQVRLEGIRTFARLKGDAAGIAGPLIARLRDEDAGVRREALRQAVRWTPPSTSRVRSRRRLPTAGESRPRRQTGAAEAMAAQVRTPSSSRCLCCSTATRRRPRPSRR